MSDETPTTTRRERERERHRGEILDAAEALLADKGLEGLTMEEIAKASEFSVGSLYRFFGSKEDLVEALIAAHMESLCASVDTLVGPFDARLDRFLDLYANEVERNIPLVQFLFSGKRPMMPKEGEISPLREVMGRLVDATSRLLERGIREEELGAESSATMAVVLLSLLDGLSRSAWLMGRRDMHAVLPVARRAFLDGYRRR